MDNDLIYNTFLFCSNKKFIISVVQSNDLKTIYEEEKFLDSQSESLELNKLDIFLNDNIYKIEKKIDSFIKDIYLILEIEDFNTIQISIKNNNNENIFSSSSLAYSLNEAKELCFKASNDEKIIHMIIDNYQIDKKNYSKLPKNIKCNNFSLDLRFICLPNLLVKNLEKILRKYQISIKKILNNRYIESLFEDDNKNLYQKAKEVTEGFNENEVKLQKKTNENQGFFERFFNYFN